ncbi:hypothetical protein PHLCEN_2v5155 [Hermanssonia centrifuga]|uniref:Uncharacterized protein n=1 Tax=Hermanssonia centrifuga TaxID=98765 RepID=A0A2R6P8U5_9APHY|nr:hypothetical protein PHLCEN_2v5155 [Hermanssonia centrifuga]
MRILEYLTNNPNDRAQLFARNKKAAKANGEPTTVAKHKSIYYHRRIAKYVFERDEDPVFRNNASQWEEALANAVSRRLTELSKEFRVHLRSLGKTGEGLTIEQCAAHPGIKNKVEAIRADFPWYDDCHLLWWKQPAIDPTTGSSQAGQGLGDEAQAALFPNARTTPSGSQPAVTISKTTDSIPVSAAPGDDSSERSDDAPNDFQIDIDPIASDLNHGDDDDNDIEMRDSNPLPTPSPTQLSFATTTATTASTAPTAASSTSRKSSRPGSAYSIAGSAQTRKSGGSGKRSLQDLIDRGSAMEEGAIQLSLKRADIVMANQETKRARYNRDRTVQVERIASEERKLRLQLEHELEKERLAFDRQQLQQEHERQKWAHEERMQGPTEPQVSTSSSFRHT